MGSLSEGTEGVGTEVELKVGLEVELEVVVSLRVRVSPTLPPA